MAIEDLFLQAGFPEDLFRTVLVKGNKCEHIIKNHHIKAVTLTGSTPAGRSVASQAGSQIKKTVLELGGNDPYIIFDDADIENAVETCFLSKMINGGQSCIAAKRFIVTEKARSEFEYLFTEKMKQIKMGDPFDPAVELGPMARKDLRDDLHGQVTRSIAKGATCLTGAFIPELQGAFYPPTVLTNVKKGMPAYDDELFGPVAAIIPVSNEKEAIETANDSDFGLGAAVFSRNISKAEEIAAKKIRSGNCFVNTFVKSDPRLPFGGIKQSGYGRELAEYGIKEFVNIKTVYIK
jgi:succinate-semialdehyde dehydrogenase/glutarate-semialdehyde dehydrogenase